MWQKAGSLWQIQPTPRLYLPGGSTDWRFGQLHGVAEGLAPYLPFPYAIVEPI